MKTGRLTNEERAEIERLAERRLKPSQIAMRLDRHPGTVNFAMHAMGLRAPAAREFDYVRNGIRVKSFSREDDAFITALRVQNFTPTKIADLITKRTGHARTPATINTRLKMLANLEESA